jgi:cyclopropane fatty-acyl-phospholipid synthase-like methyltransferase
MELLNVMFNQIILMNLCLTFIGITLFLYYKKVLPEKQWNFRYLFPFLVFYVFILNEIFYYVIGHDYVYPGGARTELVYSTNSIREVLSKDLNKVSTNLTEGYYPDKKAIPPEEAERNRFDEFIRLLDIKKGDAVLDAGCGHGGLVKYLRSKEIDAYGITITKTQYNENIQEHGPYFFYGDYTEFQSELVNKFDHIILPGSLEHPFDGNFSHESAYQRKFDGMKKMFEIMKKYFKPDSNKKKILTTCIHMNLKFKDSVEMYTLGRVCGGIYPPIDKLSVADSLESVGYKVLMNEDYSWHYYFATVSDPHHFGNPIHVGIPFYLFTLWIYPITIYCNHVLSNGAWMYQWDGKQHTPEHKNYSFEEDIHKRPCTLFYTVAQLK